ncbi:ATP-binding protein [Streptomyces sp. MS19]|uniref:ATP-binding protein n=1 Tax=Streptomyces sp. MS19 TaxID=3385972 RepID=UPI0039A1AAEC
MKQSTKKTLGAVALGAAFAAVGAGSAAAVAPLDGVSETAGGVVRTLPAHDVARTLPGESGEVVEAGAGMLTGKTDAVTTAHHTLSATQAASPLGQATELLGGLPVNPADSLGIPTSQVLDGVSIAR